MALVGSDKAIKIRLSRIKISFAWIECSKFVIVIADLLSITAILYQGSLFQLE